MREREERDEREGGGRGNSNIAAVWGTEMQFGNGYYVYLSSRYNHYTRTHK